MSSPTAAGLSPTAVSPSALPAIDEARLPAGVREGSPKAKQAYETARGFEEVLLNELTQEMCKTSGLGGEGEGEAEGAGSEEGSSQQSGGGMLSSLLPQTLAESVSRQGSLGLAGALTTGLDPGAGKSSAGTTGGISA
jgi:Rod binding domain-containing protein